MPVKAEINESKRLIIYTYSDPVDIDELEALLEKTRLVFDGATDPIYIIVDVTGITEIPVRLVTFAVRGRTNLRHPKMGAAVVILGNPAMRRIAELALRLLPKLNMHFVSSIHEAHAEIDRILQDGLHHTNVVHNLDK